MAPSQKGQFPKAQVSSEKSRFIQVRSADQARRAVGKVIQPGGWLYILGQVLDNSRLSPLETVQSNLFFLNIFNEGQAYTEQE